MKLHRSNSVLLPISLASLSVLLVALGTPHLFAASKRAAKPAPFLAADPQQSRAADMAGIDDLHRKDLAATLARDPKQLEELWTEDAVRLEPGSTAEVGLATIHANDMKEIAAHPGARVLSYLPDIRDVQIVGDCAYEWDNFVASFQESADAKVQTFHAKALRVLRKQPDGSWKFARVSWNLNE